MKGQPRFRIGHLKILDHLILGIIDHQIKTGEPVHESFSLEFLHSNTWEKVCENLLLGRLDGAFLPIPAAIDLFAQGLKIRLLMLCHRSGSLIVRKDNNWIDTIKDFNGRCVLIPDVFSLQNMLLHRLMTSAGLRYGAFGDPDAQVVYETAAPYLMPQMLEMDDDNDIAGFAVAEPFGTFAIEKKIARKVCRSDDLWRHHPCCGFVTTDDYLECHPDRIAHIITAFLAAARQIETQKDPALFKIAGEFLGQEPALVQRAFESSNICFDPDLLTPHLSDIDTIYNYMAKTMKLMDHELDLKQFIHSELFET